MQTAVEWLVNVVQSCIAPDYIPKEIIEQAKQMEKEQIIDAYYGKINGVFGYREEGQEYYNQTYNQN